MSLRTFLFGDPKPETFKGYIHAPGDGPLVSAVRNDPFPPSPRVGLFEKISIRWDRLCVRCKMLLPGARARQQREADEFVAYTMGRLHDHRKLFDEPASPERSRKIERF